MWCVHPAERSALIWSAKSRAAARISARTPDCLTKAKKKKALERCFEQPVPAEVYEALAAQLAEAAKEAADNGKEE